MEKMITPDELTKLLKLSKNGLANMRAKGNGPPFIKIGDGPRGRVRYLLEDVEKWIAESKSHSN